MPTQNLLERYEAHRTRRFLANQERTSGWLLSWRTQSRRRLLTVILAVALAAMFVATTATYFTPVAALAWLPLTLVFLATWTSLQIVSSRLSDAPRHALDEREVSERNSARSIGLSAAQTLVLVPILALLLGSSIDSIDHQALSYAAGGFTLVSILLAGCLPAMILAWIRPDDDPEDAL
ncbi:hypothetical protein F8M49_17355 [Rhodococcus zopfii]|uniref:Uncharacterized protein n=1 Tax=Rhodococcus zopfii TaxID=43772 RepID=A0ABU3WRM2_9NOCA|nr:hypothetical protein [Rhodococcus zopfii]